MLKCAHLCIFRLVCACTGQICCLMHIIEIVLYFQIQYSLQFVLYVYMEFILYFVFCIFPTRISGGIGIRGIITPVYRKTVCTVTLSCKIERPLFCIVYRNATLMCICVDTSTYFYSSTHPFQVLFRLYSSRPSTVLSVHKSFQQTI